MPRPPKTAKNRDGCQFTHGHKTEEAIQETVSSILFIVPQEERSKMALTIATILIPSLPDPPATAPPPRRWASASRPGGLG